MTKKIKNFTITIISIFLSLNCASDEKYTNPEIADTVEKVANSVVRISTELGFGSGIILSSDGKIVTNYHVISNANEGSIKLLNGSYFPIDGIISAKPDSDLALIKVNGKDLKSVQLGTSDDIKVGVKIFTVGNPEGIDNSVSEGIISNLNVNIEGVAIPLMRITAPISPGSSGGGVFNYKGHLVGITTSTSGEAGSQNSNFAIPIDYVEALMTENNITYEFVNKSAKLDDVTGTPIKKINPFFPFLTNLLYRVILFSILIFIIWLITWLFFQKSIQEGSSPFIAYSLWASICMILFLIAAFITFVDLTYDGNYAVNEIFTQVPIFSWILFVILIFTVLTLTLSFRSKARNV